MQEALTSEDPSLVWPDGNCGTGNGLVWAAWVFGEWVDVEVIAGIGEVEILVVDVKLVIVVETRDSLVSWVAMVAWNFHVLVGSSEISSYSSYLLHKIIMFIRGVNGK